MKLFEYPGSENEVARRAKEFKYPNCYKVPKGIGKSKKIVTRKAVLHGENGKMYGARATVQRSLGEGITFKQFLTETENGLVPIDIFFGRFQPFHAGHYETVSRMKNPLIIVVTGGKTGNDRSVNPLNFDQQKQLIQHAMEGQEVRVFASTDLKTFDGKPISAGFAPSLVFALKRMGFQVKHIYCGEDRVDAYRRQIASSNTKAGQPIAGTDRTQEALGLTENDVIAVDRLASGTEVRAAIKTNNYPMFKKLMPKSVASEDWFKTLQQWMGT